MNLTVPLIAGSFSVLAGLFQLALLVPQPELVRASSSVDVVDGTSQRFDLVSSLVQALPVNERIARLAEAFLGSPYLAYSLEGSGTERLRLDLTQFDCMLFVEQLLAMATADSFDEFAQRTRRLRYRNGHVDYCTRQHYFHDWVLSAQDQGLLESDRSWPGQATRALPLNYMSSHRDQYPALQSPRLFDCIHQRERGRRIEQQYLPLASLEIALPSLRSGDLFAVATSVRGLDVSHTGVLVRDGSRLDAIHAAPGHGVIRSRSFARYLRSLPDAIGAVIVRPRSRITPSQPH